jgi:hypothetical protein
LFPEFAGIIYRYCCIREFLYLDIFLRLKDAVGRKGPEKWRTNSFFLLYDSVPVQNQFFVKVLSAKNNVTILEPPPYSPDLAVADFYLFPRLKSALKGQCFCDATDIIKKATEGLKSLPKHGFQECFQEF